jgi:ketosteroid isomerase-like protein
MTGPERQPLETAAALVAAFGRGDVAAYFDFFAPDATFVFHTTPQLLDSVDEYRREWAAWEREYGFRVVSCVSSEQRVQHLGSVAVFTHRVRTRLATNAGEEELRERETIVFQQREGERWVAVHEHLSPDPGLG